MGQRLVINNHTTLLPNTITNNIYFHWSAYTDSTIYELYRLVNIVNDFYNNANTDKGFADEIAKQMMYNNNVDKFNKACLNNVTGVFPKSTKSLDYIKNNIKPNFNNDNVNRNDGIIAFDIEDINENLFWSDRTVNVYWKFKNNGTPDFDKSTFNLKDVFWIIDANDLDDDDIEFNQYIESLKDTRCDIDLANIPLSILLTKESTEKLINSIPNVWYEPAKNVYIQKIA